LKAEEFSNPSSASLIVCPVSVCEWKSDYTAEALTIDCSENARSNGHNLLLCLLLWPARHHWGRAGIRAKGNLSCCLSIGAVHRGRLNDRRPIQAAVFLPNDGRTHCLIYQSVLALLRQHKLEICPSLCPFAEQ
jgi:hypothetical protein